MVELAFSKLLLASQPITAICNNRISPVRLPTNATMPAIHFMFVGGSSQLTQDGQGTQRYRVEVSCWGNSYADAVTLRAAVVTTLNGYKANNLFITFLQNIDFDDHETLQFRALAEFYLYSNMGQAFSQ